MVVLNKGKRAHIVSPSIVVSGGEMSYDNRVVYINPGERAELQDEAGKNLVKVYPEDLIVLEETVTKKKKG